ncbi:MAG: hypothetical protein HYV97_06790 [Bdellovibrio sp.]|nr:hypothetical protein [Bdellovibrio sp.]
MRISHTLFICLTMYLAIEVRSGEIFPENTLDSAEYVLYYEIMSEGDPPALANLPGSGRYVPAPPKRILRIKKTPPQIKLVPVKSATPGFPELSLTKDGVFLNGKLICSWSYRKYNSGINHGAGVMLRGCPSWVPFKTYDGGLEFGEVKILLSIPYTKKEGNQVTVKLFEGMEFVGELPKLKQSWLNRLSRKKTDAIIIKKLFDLDKNLLQFLSLGKKCFAGKNWQECLGTLIPKRRSYFIWDEHVESSPIVCPINKKFKELTYNEYVNCLAENIELKKELQTCFSHKSDEYQSIWLKDVLKLVSEVSQLQAVLRGEENVALELDGTYFKCKVARIGKKWNMTAIVPNLKRIIQEQADALLVLKGPDTWPFKKISPVESGEALNNYFILRR